MSIELTWHTPDRILLMSWSGCVTADDLHILIDELDVVYRNADHLIHAIIDFYGLEKIDYEVALTIMHHHILTDCHRGEVGLVRVPNSLLSLVARANAVVEIPFLHVFESRSAAYEYLTTLDPDSTDC